MELVQIICWGEAYIESYPRERIGLRGFFMVDFNTANDYNFSKIFSYKGVSQHEKIFDN